MNPIYPLLAAMALAACITDSPEPKPMNKPKSDSVEVIPDFPKFPDPNG